MPIDELLRDELRRASASVEGGPDLRTCLHDGRRMRRRRHLVLGSGVVAAVAGIAVGAASIVGYVAPSQGNNVAAAGATSSYPDFVPGTDVDETMQATVADAVADAGTATDVYPSDWNHDDALPDARFADATDWEAFYTINNDERLLVVMGYEKDVERSVCKEGDPLGDPKAPTCSRDDLPSGGTVATSGYTLIGSPEHVFVTTYVQGSFVVNVLDYVDASSWGQADQRRHLDQAELTTLATDPALTFAAPNSWPSRTER